MDLKSKIVTSIQLRKRDRFKIAGQMYKVTDTCPNDVFDLIIWATNTEDDSQIQLIVGLDSKFKIYRK